MNDEDLPAQLQSLRVDHEALKRRVGTLEDDIMEIKADLKLAATKEDVRNIHSHIDQSINGILRDAINAAPARQQVVVSIVMAAVAVLTVLNALHVFK